MSEALLLHGKIGIAEVDGRMRLYKVVRDVSRLRLPGRFSLV